MRSHWTNPTIVRRPSIAALAAAALLVACDQPAGPSRPGGRILADATGGNVSAHGSGTVPGWSSDFDAAGVFHTNTGALKFSFDFSGTNTAATDIVLVSGNWSVRDPVTNVALDYTGPATVILPYHTLTVESGSTCTITAANGTMLAQTCSLQAQDLASNGGVDTICFEGSAGNAFIATLGVIGDIFELCPQLASGNMIID